MVLLEERKTLLQSPLNNRRGGSIVNPKEQTRRTTEKILKKERIASGKKDLSEALNFVGLNTSEKNITHNLRSDGADGLHYVSGGHVPFRASYYPSEDKLIVTYPNVRNEFEGSLKDQKFLDVIQGLIEDVKENNPVENVDKLSVEELKRNIQTTKESLRIHGHRKELFEKYQRKGGDDRWSEIQGRIERKLDGLQQEYKRRFAEVNKKPAHKDTMADLRKKEKQERKDSSKKPTSIRVNGSNSEEAKNTNKKMNEAIKQGGESFTRVNLPDIPDAHKVNLTKYLSAKRKKAVDDAWNKAKFDSLPREKASVFQEGYNKLREQFNNNFDDMSKSERAELLYKILKMKNAMERK